jgi:transposase-like protein
MLGSVENGNEGRRGAGRYLCRAIDKQGRLINFMLSVRQSTEAATRFLGKAPKIRKDWPPSSIITVKLVPYPRAIQRLKRLGKMAGRLGRQSEADLSALHGDGPAIAEQDTQAPREG